MKFYNCHPSKKITVCALPRYPMQKCIGVTIPIKCTCIGECKDECQCKNKCDGKCQLLKQGNQEQISEQNQIQQQNPEQTQALGNQQQNPEQNPIQTLGDQQLTPEQNPIQTLGDQQQNPEQDQFQFARLGDQNVGGHTNTSPLENNQTISTPVNVEGVSVNVKCGDCKPIIVLQDLKNDECKKREEHREERKCNLCKQDCGNCSQCLCDLFEKVREFQATITDPVDKQIDIYLTSLPSPVEDQVITNVIDCCVVKFKSASQITIVPNTTVQLCNVAGISADDSGDNPNIFDFLIEQANIMDNSDKCKFNCKCPRCASGIGEELACTANYGILVNVSIKGFPTAIPLYVLNVKDCLVYFVDSITAPTEISVFSLCFVTGFTVETQTI